MHKVHSAIDKLFGQRNRPGITMYFVPHIGHVIGLNGVPAARATQKNLGVFKRTIHGYMAGSKWRVTFPEAEELGHQLTVASKNLAAMVALYLTIASHASFKAIGREQEQKKKR